MSVLQGNPFLDGYKSVAENEKHSGTIIMFPERGDIWRNNAKEAQDLVLHIANTIIDFEPVLMCAKSYMVSALKKRLDSRIKIFEVDYDDIWTRDIAPNFVVKNNNLRAVNWQFNAWGGIESGAYYPWDDDNKFAVRLADFLGIDYYNVEDIVLEGGGVITDGEGTLFTTESVLINSNRNPGKDKQYIESALKKYFNVAKVIWLPQGLFLDETDGHIDNVCSIVGKAELCVAFTYNPDNDQYSTLQAAYKILSNEKDAKGNKFLIHKIPMPEEQFITKEESLGIQKTQTSTNRAEGFKLVPSYINYYLINGGVLVPSFGCEIDYVAVSEMEKIFSDRKIIQIPSKEILIGGGGFHCIMHEIPYAKGAKW